MAGRRILYIVLLAAATVYHFAYGQYATNYILLFLLCLPVLSLLISIPAAFFSRVELKGATDVYRNAKGSVRLCLGSRFFLPPSAWLVKLEEQNLFTEKSAASQVIRIGGQDEPARELAPNTSRLGTIRYKIKKARIYDHLGLFSLPVRKSGEARMTVLPNIERPRPMPVLDDPSDIVLKPKPLGFSEEHELRQYRSGDSLNLIHWKLSSKYDELIVREPQELLKKNIVLSVDPPASYDGQQSVLEQLRCLNELLIEDELAYRLVFGSKSLRIASEDDFTDFIKTVLSHPMQSEQAKSIPLDGRTLIYRVLPAKGVSE